MDEEAGGPEARRAEKVAQRSQGARQIIADFTPAMTRAEYLTFARGLFKTERYSGAEA